ncbi:MAG: type II secretion system protein [Candidatus Eremiobacterota bacterium]
MKKCGMTLAELSVTIAILGVVLVGMILFFTTGIQAIKKNNIMIPVVNIANEQIEKMREMSYDTIINNYYPSSEFDIKKNNMDYKMKITTKVIYEEELVDIFVNINWQGAGKQGKKELDMQTFIYTSPTPVP